MSLITAQEVGGFDCCKNWPANSFMCGLYAVTQPHQRVCSLCYWTLIFVARRHSIPGADKDEKRGRRYFLLSVSSREPPIFGVSGLKKDRDGWKWDDQCCMVWVLITHCSTFTAACLMEIWQIDWTVQPSRVRRFKVNSEVIRHICRLQRNLSERGKSGMAFWFTQNKIWIWEKWRRSSHYAGCCTEMHQSPTSASLPLPYFGANSISLRQTLTRWRRLHYNAQPNTSIH